MEDTRHAVFARVLEHYKSLHSGDEKIPDQTDEFGRKPLEGDWYVRNFNTTNLVPFALRTFRSRRWRIPCSARRCAEIIFTKNVLINGHEVKGMKDWK